VTVGRVVEARRVLCGPPGREGAGWRAEARLVNPATEEGEALTVQGGWEWRG
jgi:hypothetical protein